MWAIYIRGDVSHIGVVHGLQAAIPSALSGISYLCWMAFYRSFFRLNITLGGGSMRGRCLHLKTYKPFLLCGLRAQTSDAAAAAAAALLPPLSVAR